MQITTDELYRQLAIKLGEDPDAPVPEPEVAEVVDLETARREREQPDEPTIDVRGGLVELDLGKFARIGAPVTALYLPPDVAEQWAKELVWAADEARGTIKGS